MPYLGVQPVPQAVIRRGIITATEGQTSFPTSGYFPGYVDVWLNGSKLVDGDDYTATNGSDVVLTVGASVGDSLEWIATVPFEVANQAFTGLTSLEAFKLSTTIVSSATYTVLSSDGNIYVNAGSNSVAITLPALSASLGRRITVRVSAITAPNTITIQRAGSDTIVGLTSVTLSSVGDFWTFEGGPSRWELVDGHETISGTNDGIKRADGTMEQWGYRTNLSATSSSTSLFGTSSGTSYYNGNVSTSFEEPFIGSLPIITTTNKNGAVGWSTIVRNDSASLSAFEVVLSVGGSSVANGINFMWHAIGRWYA